MITWEMAVGIVTIVSVVLIEVRQSKKTSEAWGDLSATLRDLKAYFEKEQENSKENFKDLRNQLKDHSDEISNHETRITVLEEKENIHKNSN